MVVTAVLAAMVGLLQSDASAATLIVVNSSSDVIADLDGDGVVGGSDLGELLGGRSR